MNARNLITMSLTTLMIFYFTFNAYSQSQQFENVQTPYDGRIWEYNISSIYGIYDSSNRSCTFNAKIEDCEILNDKTYNKFKIFKCENQFLSENVDGEGWLIREENGRVYSVINPHYANIEEFNNPNNNQTANFEVNQEYLLYDFNLNIGDEYPSIAYFMDLKCFTPTLVKCIDITDYDYNGFKFKRFELDVIPTSTFYDTIHHISVISDLGIISTSGFFPFIDISPQRTGPGQTHIGLEKIYNQECEVLYQSEAEKYYDYQEKSWEWEYLSISEDGTKCELFRKRITDPELIDDLIYHKFITISREKWDRTFDINTGMWVDGEKEICNIDNEPTSYLRVGNKKIYSLLRDDAKNADCEYLLYNYDFLYPRRSISTYCFNRMEDPKYEDYYVKDCSLEYESDVPPTEIMGISYTTFSIVDSFNILSTHIDCVGPIKGGTLDYPILNDGINKIGNIYLNNLYNSRGEIIYEGYNYTLNMSQENKLIIPVDDYINRPIFNIQGLKIENPSSGEIVILNNKKRIFQPSVRLW